MKRLTTIAICALHVVMMSAQINLWNSNHIYRYSEKETDSLTLEKIKLYKSSYMSASKMSQIYDYQKKLYASLDSYGYSRHNDFGYPAVCLFKETSGQDLVSANINYNWFNMYDYHSNRDASMTTIDGLNNNLVWIFLNNTVSGSTHVISANTDTYEVAQAHAMRAFGYMNLVELYPFTYVESTLLLPGIESAMDSPADDDNTPRYSPSIGTIAEVYEQILSDLDIAIEQLQGFSRTSKREIDLAVAYGLRARANLITCHFEEAAADAEKALMLSAARPLTIEEANVPGFADADADNVLWAITYNENDGAVQSGIANWQSHFSTFYSDGYTGVGATRWIASALYDQIPATDVRKGWWLNKERTSPLLDAPGYNVMKEDIINSDDYFPAYTNVKFGTGDGSVYGLSAAAGDWILMRAEELMLIRAEALERAGKDGAKLLTDFVTTYRDPSYDINAHGLSVLDEIWWQRRVELWGEGFSFSDLMRLKKGVIRSNSTNWPAAWQQDIPADDERLPWVSPVETTEKRALKIWQNNNSLNPIFPLTQIDSITFGSAKELDNVYFDSPEITERLYLSQCQSHVIKIGLSRSHNLDNTSLVVPITVVSADNVFSNIPQQVEWNNKTSVQLEIELPEITKIQSYSFTLQIPDEYCPLGYQNRDGSHEADRGKQCKYTLYVYEDPASASIATQHIE